MVALAEENRAREVIFLIWKKHSRSLPRVFFICAGEKCPGAEVFTSTERNTVCSQSLLSKNFSRT